LPDEPVAAPDQLISAVRPAERAEPAAVSATFTAPVFVEPAAAQRESVEDPPAPPPVMAVQPPPEPARVIPDLPPVALSLPPDSGLVLVETSHKAEHAAEPELTDGPRRARRARVQLADEPLQIVETRKEQPPAA
jgi:hypothetical protein